MARSMNKPVRRAIAEPVRLRPKGFVWMIIPAMMGPGIAQRDV